MVIPKSVFTRTWPTLWLDILLWPTQEPPPSPFWQLTRTMVWVNCRGGNSDHGLSFLFSTDLQYFWILAVQVLRGLSFGLSWVVPALSILGHSGHRCSDLAHILECLGRLWKYPEVTLCSSDFLCPPAPFFQYPYARAQLSLPCHLSTHDTRCKAKAGSWRGSPLQSGRAQQLALPFRSLPTRLLSDHRPPRKHKIESCLTLRRCLNHLQRKSVPT